MGRWVPVLGSGPELQALLGTLLDREPLSGLGAHFLPFHCLPRCARELSFPAQRRGPLPGHAAEARSLYSTLSALRPRNEVRETAAAPSTPRRARRSCFERRALPVVRSSGAPLVLARIPCRIQAFPQLRAITSVEPPGVAGTTSGCR